MQETQTETRFIDAGGNEITKKEAFSCPECGKEADDWSTDNVPYKDDEGKCHSLKNYTCVCHDCQQMWDFQEEIF